MPTGKIIYIVRVVNDIEDYTNDQFASYLDFSFQDYDSAIDFIKVCFSNDHEVLVRKSLTIDE